MKPTHSFDVDLTNPGQFLACCGLLELANAVDAAATAWFGDKQFFISAQAGSFVRRFLECPAAADSSVKAVAEDDEEESSDKSPPLRLADPFCIRLDWWEDPVAVKAGFKTWGGGQTVTGFFDGMRQRVFEAELPEQELLTRSMPVKAPKPFSFDSQLSVLTLIDLGFFPEKADATFSPAVEALTLVGLQRFRPETVDLRERYAYSTWAKPLPASIAAAVTHGLIPALSNQTFQFPFVVRTGGKYKAFGPALPTRSTHHG